MRSPLNRRPNSMIIELNIVVLELYLDYELGLRGLIATCFWKGWI